MTKKGWIPGCAMRQRNHPNCFLSQGDSVNHEKLRRGSIWRFRPIATRGVRLRSEEHTSELQSLMRISYAVFCLKKKNQTLTQYSYNLKHNPTTIYTHRY